MEKYKKIKNGLFYMAMMLCISALLATPLYILEIFYGNFYFSPVNLFITILVLTALLYVINVFTKKTAAATILILLLFWIMLALSWSAANKAFTETERYSVDDTKKELYSDKKVMVLVPHQDDEVNIAGGIIEEYVKYSSDIYVVYSTNGDYYGLQDMRFEEVKKALSRFGVDQENIILLGYGDSWEDGHIYNAGENEIKTSHLGRNETYANKDAGIRLFREGRPYTKENFLEDIKDVILEIRPDIIFCIDYDSHADHRALSLGFEKAMGEILSEEDYTPVVMKAFAYSTAWGAPADYKDVPNLGSTVNIYDTEYMQENNIYNWNERVRMPVSAQSLSRKMELSRIYEALNEYPSQMAMLFAESVINSDKVFWERETGSLLYKAQTSASSGDASLLTNFMLTDSEDILSRQLPFDGTWIPEQDDEEKTIKIQMEKETYIDRICLYDNPSMDDNVLNAIVRFDDGTEFDTGPLEPNGSSTEFTVEKSNVKNIEIRIMEKEGDKAGLSEVEAYAEKKKAPFEFIKLMSCDEDFVYDYWTGQSPVSFKLYKMGLSHELSEEHYIVSVDNEKCSAGIENGEIILNCPRGESCTISITHRESGLNDSVKITNIQKFKEKQLELGGRLNEFYRSNIAEQDNRFGRVVDQGFWKSVIRMAHANIFSY